MVQLLSKRIATFLQQTGDIGQVAPRRVVMVSKEEHEHVLTILQATPTSRQLAKKVALLLQLVGVHGQVALQHVVMVAKQELEHALLIKEVPPMSHKLAIFDNAVSDIQGRF